jgi:hypothetical protein
MQILRKCKNNNTYESGIRKRTNNAYMSGIKIAKGFYAYMCAHCRFKRSDRHQLNRLFWIRQTGNKDGSMDLFWHDNTSKYFTNLISGLMLSFYCPFYATPIEWCLHFYNILCYIRTSLWRFLGIR